MSEIHTMPGHIIRRLQQISSSIFAQHMRDAGFDLTSPQFATLSILQDQPNIDQATLASAIAIDRATIGGIVDRLVAKGLVQRQTNPQDRRARVLSLTDEGHRILTRLHPVVQNVQDIILQNLTAEETRGFMRLAAKISAQDETTGTR